LTKNVSNRVALFSREIVSCRSGLLRAGFFTEWFYAICFAVRSQVLVSPKSSRVASRDSRRIFSPIERRKSPSTSSIQQVWVWRWTRSDRNSSSLKQSLCCKKNKKHWKQWRRIKYRIQIKVIVGKSKSKSKGGRKGKRCFCFLHKYLSRIW